MKIEIPGSTDSTYDVSEKRDEQSQAPQAARARAAGGGGLARPRGAGQGPRSWGAGCEDVDAEPARERAPLRPDPVLDDAGERARALFPEGQIHTEQGSLRGAGGRNKGGIAPASSGTQRTARGACALCMCTCISCVRAHCVACACMRVMRACVHVCICEHMCVHIRMCDLCMCTYVC